MPNEEWGLVGNVAIVTGGGAADDSIGEPGGSHLAGARRSQCPGVDRDLTLADRTVEVTAAEGGNAVAASYDVTSSAQCAAMVKEAVSRWGTLAVTATERAQGCREATCSLIVSPSLERTLLIS